MKGNVALTEVAVPYAEALMSVAQSRNLTEEFGDDVRALLNLLSQSEQLQKFLDNPFIQAEDKKAVINRILGEGANTYLRNFLMLLVDRRRIMLLEDVCQQYLALLRQLKQTVLAEVVSAVPLSEAQQQAVKEKVIGMTNAREVELETKIDPDIIGGVIIKVGSQVIDASLRGQLRRLSLRLTSA
ncbi:MAG: F0F1 ATP synthase subunit delta [Fischerella sp.]|jgi:F-type H+-transporting ATPase subunit delta|uniref:ATP synthase F1 subunit delta n=1 Tax=Fischerella sp. TaxID=1191 RepID=UPI0017A0105C|nr:ATP synthase F1 subunit delta [Fischerella sp.]NWF59988.1 F0F1 ATP synthase subunit delta [Fischerella sp.]